MNTIAAVGTGAGLGIAYFGGLWLSIRRLCKPGGTVWLGIGRLARLALVGLGFSALVREGADALLAGLGGLWLARWCLIRQLGGRHAP